MFLCYWSSSIAFCGLVFRGTDVVWPLRSFYYALPLRWLFNSVGYDIYSPSSFSGAANCAPSTNVTTDQGIAVCTSAGFYCDDSSSSFGCWGHTGQQVLATLHKSYESLDADDERAMNVGIILGMMVAMKIGFNFALWVKVSASDSPREAKYATAT